MLLPSKTYASEDPDLRTDPRLLDVLVSPIFLVEYERDHSSLACLHVATEPVDVWGWMSPSPSFLFCLVPLVVLLRSITRAHFQKKLWWLDRSVAVYKLSDPTLISNPLRHVIILPKPTTWNETKVVLKPHSWRKTGGSHRLDEEGLLHTVLHTSDAIDCFPRPVEPWNSGCRVCCERFQSVVMVMTRGPLCIIYRLWFIYRGNRKPYVVIMVSIF